MNRDSIFRAIRTFIISFLALWLPLLFGFLQELTNWANGQGAQPFPDMSGLAYGAVSAVTAAVIAIVNLVWNGVEDSVGAGMLRPVPTDRRRRNRT